MLQYLQFKHGRVALSFVSAAVLSIALSGCVSGAERRQVNLQADTDTCQSFGASYGSPAYTKCMLEQQHRRDSAQRESLERTRLTTQIARDAQISPDRARKERCDRDPDRKECGR
jgi:hypothetical protein